MGKKRINTVNSIKKIVSVSKMIAISKMMKKKKIYHNIQRSLSELNNFISQINFENKGFNVNSLEEILNIKYDNSEYKSVKLLFVFGSDLGLCGGINSSVINFVNSIITDPKNSENQYIVYCVGKKMNSYMGRLGSNKNLEIIGFSSCDELEGIVQDEKQFINFIKEILLKLNSSMHYKIESIDSIFHNFINVNSTNICQNDITQTMSIDLKSSNSVGNSSDNISEEFESQVMLKLFYYNFINCLYSNVLSVEGSRMLAMENAVKNADELHKNLKISFNKQRQANITNEILDVVSGAQAASK